YYNAHAFVNGRAALDFAVADKETHFNPLLDVPFYYLVRGAAPTWVGFVMGALHGVGPMLVFAIAHRVLSQTGMAAARRASLAAACAIAGACEPMFLGQLATTYHDNLLAVFVLSAVL